MRVHSFYDAATGIFSGRTFSTNWADDAAHLAALRVNTPVGHAAATGKFDHLSQRVDLDKLKADDDAAATAWAAKKDENRLKRTAGGDPGEDPPPPARVIASDKHVVDYQPPSPGPDFEWNAAAKRWQLNASARQRSVDKAAADHLRSQQHDLIRTLTLDPGNAEARARLQALHQQITALEGN
jgi:hypothetical protein